MQQVVQRLARNGLILTLCWVTFSAEAQADTSRQPIQGTACVAQDGTSEQTKSRATLEAVVNALNDAPVQDSQSGRATRLAITPRATSLLIRSGVIQQLKPIKIESARGQVCVTITAAVKQDTLIVLGNRYGEFTAPGGQETSRQPPRTLMSTQPSDRARGGSLESPSGSVPSLPSSDHAEFYLGAYGGLSIPNDLHQTSFTGGTLSGYTINDQRLQNSAIYGAKVGLFFPGSMRWLGTEIEAFNTTPHVKQQTLTVSGMGQSSTDPDVSGRHFRVTTIALNVIARYPGTRVQPYVGVGFGGFFYQMQGFTEGFAPGLNALAGARVFLAEHVALFAEYKYTHATLQFKDLLGVGTGTVNATYSTNAVVGGLSLHF